MGEEGRAANKERVEYLTCLTCRPRAMEKNRQLLQYVKAKEQTVKRGKKARLGFKNTLKRKVREGR